MYSMGTILILNLMFIIIFFKELKIVTFDPALAAVLGFAPTFIHYSLMTIVSITAVGAFESVGSILVIAFMIGPPITAYLLTDDLKHLIFISSGVGAINGILGYQFAHYFDVSISGAYEYPVVLNVVCVIGGQHPGCRQQVTWHSELSEGEIEDHESRR